MRAKLWTALPGALLLVSAHPVPASPVGTIELEAPSFVLRSVAPTSIEFGSADLPAIPADFFYPGSDPFVGVVDLQGVAERVRDDGDLMIRVVGSFVLPLPPASAQILIEIVTLELESVQPIAVTGTAPPLLVDIEVSSVTASGTLSIDRLDLLGGTLEYAWDPLERVIHTTDPNGVVRDLPHIAPAGSSAPLSWTTRTPASPPDDALLFLPDGVQGELSSDVPGYQHSFEQAVGVPAALTDDQRRCVRKLNNRLRKLGKRMGKDWDACLKGRLLGGIPDVEACVASDLFGLQEREADKLRRDADKHCGAAGRPSFGSLLAPPLEAAALLKEGTIVHTLFGSDLDAALLPDETGRRCQQRLLHDAFRCEDTRLKLFRNCKKDLLKAGAASAEDLVQGCLGAAGIPDPNLNGIRLCTDRFNLDLTERCLLEGVDLSDAFPGCPSDDVVSVGVCIEGIIECNLCLALDTADGLRRDCDDFDDGQLNGSCEAFGFATGP